VLANVVEIFVWSQAELDFGLPAVTQAATVDVAAEGAPDSGAEHIFLAARGG
jgi:hypothetical protein